MTIKYQNHDLITNGDIVATSGIFSSGISINNTIITDFNSSVSGLVSGIYSPLFNPSFSGIPTAPTAPSGTNNSQIANTQFVRSEISNLVNSAPSTLDTLNELATALGNDPNFATTIASGLGQKSNVGHTHSSSDITNFNSSVSGLLPSVSGSGYVNTSFNNNSYTISVSGLQPSGNYANSVHNHVYTDITNFASGVNNSLTTTLLAGNFINLIYDSNLDTLTIGTSGLQPSGNYSVVGHTHTSSNISDFNSSVSGLLPVKNIVGSTYVGVSSSSGIFTISATGLQPSGNYSVVGHTHSSSNITDFNSSVSGLLPVKNIVSGTGILVTNSSGIYTINSAISGVAESASLVTNVFNKTASTINKGSVVYVNGGQGDQPTIQLAIAGNEIGSSKTYGIVQNNIPSMSLGKVVVAGALTGFNTDQFNPTAPHGDVNGTTLWLSPSISGTMTTIKPSAPNHMVSVGTIVRTHQNEGVIEVRIQNGFELEELHNVAISGVSDGQFLQYNSASGLWLASNSGDFTTLQVNGTGVVASSGGSSGYLSKFTGSNTIDNSLIYDNGTYIGIGTDTPNANLTIAANGAGGTIDGAVQSQPFQINDGGSGPYINLAHFNITDAGARGSFTLSNNASSAWENNVLQFFVHGTSYPYAYYGDNISDAGCAMIVTQGDEIVKLQIGNHNYAPIEFFTDNTFRVKIAEDGNVGIGTANPIYKLDVDGSGNFTSLYVNTVEVSVSGHNHNSSDITDFNSSVSGLLPITNILGGSNITISQSGTEFTVAVTGSLGLTTEEVDDRVNNLLVAGTGISLNYDDNANTLTIGTSGLQPSGNYSIVGHSHTVSNITDFNSSVSGLLPTIDNSGDNRILTNTGTSLGINAENNLTFDGNLLNVAGSGVFTNSVIASGFIKSGGTSSQFLKADGTVDGSSYYLSSNPSGYTSNVGTITNVSSLILGTSGTDVSSSVYNETTTPVITLNLPSASASNRGLLTSSDWTTFNNKQPSGNYSTVGHTHVAANITDFSSAVSGLLSKSIITFTPAGNQPPVSNYAVLDTRNSILVLNFDPNTQWSAVFCGVIPQNASLTNGLTVRIWWMGQTATSGNVRWGVSFEKVGTDNDADSFDNVTQAHSAANGTSGIETVTSITATAIDSLAAGDRFRLKVTRIADDAVNDTMTGNAQLVAVEVVVA